MYCKLSNRVGKSAGSREAVLQEACLSGLCLDGRKGEQERKQNRRKEKRGNSEVWTEFLFLQRILFSSKKTDEEEE